MQLDFQESIVATVSQQFHVVPLDFLHHWQSIFYRELLAISRISNMFI